MSGNPLGMLPERAFRAAGMINLQKVYLSNCSLARVDATAFEGLVILIELDLTHNHLREAIQWHENNFKTILGDFLDILPLLLLMLALVASLL